MDGLREARAAGVTSAEGSETGLGRSAGQVTCVTNVAPIWAPGWTVAARGMPPPDLLMFGKRQASLLCNRWEGTQRGMGGDACEGRDSLTGNQRGSKQTEPQGGGHGPL